MPSGFDIIVVHNLAASLDEAISPKEIIFLMWEIIFY